MAEDITQDPEYVKGYERGIRAWKYEHSLERQGFNAGYHVFDTQQTVESKAVPGNSEQSEQENWKERYMQLSQRLDDIEQRLDGYEKRLSKFERYIKE